ncbi:MAG: AmmeMemoRadiSam system radical SAM enzyme [Candidatus Rifleibacteriota bacterium]
MLADERSEIAAPSKAIDVSTLHEAQFWRNLENAIKCELCPNGCTIVEGRRGRCRGRENIGGKLYAMGYGKLSTIAIDPIEKKPVYHMLPGSKALSISTAGCVLSCKYCQNWQISQASPEEVCNIKITPEEVVAKALETECKSIAYTYNEPTVFYEFMYATAELAKKKGLKNVMVSCGYINPKPLEKLIPVIDVIKVDLKGFSKDFYQKISGGKLEPVKQTIMALAEAGKLLDIVCLIIPGLNDNEETCREMFAWLKKVGGTETTVFLSRFFPTYRLQNIAPTPISKLEKLHQIALDQGLNYVYIGNAPGHKLENTYCHSCKKMLIERLGYQILQNRLKDGRCPYCGAKIPGIWA